MKFYQWVLALLPLIVVLVFGIVVNYRIGYFYWGESGKYLEHYLTKKPLLVKLFDFHQHDAYVYRPREVGNIFNMADAYLLLFFAWIGVTNFLSPVHYASMFFIVCIPLYIASRQPSHRGFYMTIATLFGVLFLTSPAPFMTAFYFRTSKSIVAAIIALFVFLLFYLHKSKSKKLIYPVIVCFLTFLLGTIDEIGIIIGGVFILYFFVLVVVESKWRLFSGSLLGIVGIFVYRSFVAQYLTWLAIGEHPVAWGDMSVIPHSFSSFLSGVELLFSYFGDLHGGVRSVALLPIILIVGTILFYGFYLERIQKYDKHNHIQKVLVFLATGITFAVISIISIGVTMMIANHSEILIEEIRWTYYSLPFVTLWFFSLVLACFILIKRYSKLFYALVVIVSFCIVGNIVKLQEHEIQLQTSSNVTQYMKAADPLIENIDKQSVSKSETFLIPGSNVIYVFRELLGREVRP